MKAFIVVLLALVTMAAAADVHRRLFLPGLDDLVNRLKNDLAHLASSPSLEAECESLCKTFAALLSLLCPTACTVVTQALGGSVGGLVTEAQ